MVSDECRLVSGWCRLVSCGGGLVSDWCRLAPLRCGFAYDSSSLALDWSHFVSFGVGLEL